MKRITTFDEFLNEESKSFKFDDKAKAQSFASAARNVRGNSMVDSAREASDRKGVWIVNIKADRNTMSEIKELLEMNLNEGISDSAYSKDAWKNFELIDTVNGVEFYKNPTNSNVYFDDVVDPKDLDFVSKFIKKHMPHLLHKIVINKFWGNKLDYSLLSVTIAINGWSYGRYVNQKAAEEIAELILNNEIHLLEHNIRKVEYSTDSWNVSADTLRKIEKSL